MVGSVAAAAASWYKNTAEKLCLDRLAGWLAAALLAAGHRETKIVSTASPRE